MFNKIKSFFSPKPSKIDLDIIDYLQDKKVEQQMLYDHIIAIARLSMIKPQTLFKEARKVEANSEYLLKMAEYMKSKE